MFIHRLGHMAGLFFYGAFFFHLTGGSAFFVMYGACRLRAGKGAEAGQEECYEDKDD